VTDRIPPTFGDLCCAIADGKIAATLNGSMYEVNALELRRYLSSFYAAQPVPFSEPQTEPQGGDSQSWSTSPHKTVA